MSWLNLDWWHHFTEEFFVSPSDPDIATTTILLPDGKVPPTCFLAFDLPSTEFAPVVKPYLIPHRRALLERKSTKEVALSYQLDPARSVNDRELSLHSWWWYFP
jgi:hypothetical protein